MEELDFRPSKSKEDFRNNYRLHDAAERIGCNLLTQWGVPFNSFGEDKRYERLWEKGEDKPDIVLKYNGKLSLLDWKGKHSQMFLVNERAVKSYERWKTKLESPVIIAFFLFNESTELIDRRFAVLGVHPYRVSDSKQWDKNRTIEFFEELPKFTKDNLINFIR